MIADAQMRKRDERLHGQGKHRAKPDPPGRRIYSQRIATVEPVFANIRHNKGLDRFTLRGKAKVGTQWRLFCLVHNIEKLANNGYRTGRG